MGLAWVALYHRADVAISQIFTREQQISSCGEAPVPLQIWEAFADPRLVLPDGTTCLGIEIGRADPCAITGTLWTCRPSMRSR